GVTRCFRTVLLNSGLDRQMEHEKHKHFSPEFRAAAVARVAEGDKSIVKVAAALGINHRTLWTWVNSARLKTIDPAGELTPQARKRIRDLEKENALLRRDLDFEKKAKAFFLELDQNDNGSK
ncbi:transposase, partial [Cryobacterium sp. M23]|uniref:transposase n=2 Tax=unclassified Cryobacterium TaxID=2649013 RepID=UPI001E38CF9D